MKPEIEFPITPITFYRYLFVIIFSTDFGFFLQTLHGLFFSLIIWLILGQSERINNLCAVQKGVQVYNLNVMLFSSKCAVEKQNLYKKKQKP
jgi:hypothetical protein